MTTLNPSVRVLIAALLLMIWFGRAAHVRATPPWDTTGSMTIGRVSHTATLLSDGRVLVAGGSSSLGPPAFATAELYDSSSGRWTRTGSMNTARRGHHAVLLLDGRVLVVGGDDRQSTAEEFDPTTGKWTTVASLPRPLAVADALVLEDGRTLVVGETVGARASDQTTGAASVYDPVANRWVDAGTPPHGYFGGTLVSLQDGRTLYVASGDAATFDAVTFSWRPATYPPYRGGFSVTGLLDGRVLVAGGQGGERGPNAYQATAGVYDPRSDSWSPTGRLAVARTYHRAVRLTDGRVLVVGNSESIREAEVFDPLLGAWSSAGLLTVPRELPTATRLANGGVLVVGGLGGDYQATAAAEVLQSASLPRDSSPPPPDPRTLLPQLDLNGMLISASDLLPDWRVGTGVDQTLVLHPWGCELDGAKYIEPVAAGGVGRSFIGYPGPDGNPVGSVYQRVYQYLPGDAKRTLDGFLAAAPQCSWGSESSDWVTAVTELDGVADQAYIACMQITYSSSVISPLRWCETVARSGDVITAVGVVYPDDGFYDGLLAALGDRAVQALLGQGR